MGPDDVEWRLIDRAVRAGGIVRARDLTDDELARVPYLTAFDRYLLRARGADTYEVTRRGRAMHTLWSEPTVDLVHLEMPTAT